MTDERIDKERNRAEREYRAQWIRDAARDLWIAAHRSGQAYSSCYEYEHRAKQLWDLYVKERE